MAKPQISVSFLMPVVDVEIIDAAAQRINMSRSAWVKLAIRTALAAQAPATEEPSVEINV